MYFPSFSIINMLGQGKLHRVRMVKTHPRSIFCKPLCGYCDSPSSKFDVGLRGSLGRGHTKVGIER